MMVLRRYRVPLFIALVWLLGNWYWRNTSTNIALALAKQHLNGSWTQRPHTYPIGSVVPLPFRRTSIRIPKIQAAKPAESSETRRVRLSRLAAVKESFEHSWTGYAQHAWMHDEVTPHGGKYRDPFGGWAVTLVDSLDTLWLMGLKKEFELAAAAAGSIDFTTSTGRVINVFETTVRFLGGFLGAYELSEKKYPVLLAKAVEIGELLMCAFDTPHRLPITRWQWQEYAKGAKPKAEHEAMVSEMGSLALEFTKLSQLTGEMKYWDAVRRVSETLEANQQKTMLPGLWPTLINADKPSFVDGDTFTLGRMSGSVYETLPKQYLIFGGQLESPRRMYEGFIETAKKHIFWKALSPWPSPIVLPAEVQATFSNLGAISLETKHQSQHGACVSGGMVGLASRVFDRPDELALAAQLTEGCVWSYNSTQSGVGPEIFSFIGCKPVASDVASDTCGWSGARWYKAVEGRHHSELNMKPPTDKKKRRKWRKPTVQQLVDRIRLPRGMLNIDDTRYALRSEAIESVFVMYRLTGDAAWMDKAWYMFKSIERVARAEMGASAVDDVTRRHPVQLDSMESFWMAETLKYFYLVFSEFDVVSLDKWVLNTEAHPLRRPDV